ncbi:Aspartate aminotransferase [Chitinispirillum alkaliphilum]|nr:Aspartate aminotransferase [Chitinispirillum alkaliphilum]
MPLDSQATELNEAIQNANPYIFNMLSQKGKQVYFPTKGILGQTAQAKTKSINATIGISLEDNGMPMVLESIDRMLNIQKQSFSYAPSYGNPEMRSMWKEMLYRKNPSLKEKPFSLPVVTSALTHGLSMAGHLFVENGDSIICPDLYWENYDLIFKQTYGARLETFPTFCDDEKFNIEYLEKHITGQKVGKKIVMLNFPNNPSGYTVSEQEAEQIKDLLVKAADNGNDIIVFIDDAYFGLVYEKGILKESIFSLLADAHERILAVKFDGPTKEDYVWGFRVGFVSFASARSTPQLYSALESKLAGAIRGNISNASNLSQNLLLEAYRDDSYQAQKLEKFEILQKRYRKIRQIFSEHPEYATLFKPLPFNSGYFMCVKILSGDAHGVRNILLDKYDTGVIAQNDLLRIAFSSIPFQYLEKLFDNIYKAASEANGN